MKLTPAERLILANQYDILSRLTEDDYERKAYADARTIVESGYEGHYGELSPSISEKTLASEQGAEALKIMTMYSCLKSAYESLPDKSGINPTDIEFRGFDGNTEGEILAYANFFCNQDGRRFQDIVAEHVPNSHGSFLDMYRRMLRVFEAVGEPNRSAREMSKESILKVLAARYPKEE